MAKVRKYTLKFAPGDESDTKEYRMYWEHTPEDQVATPIPVTNASPFVTIPKQPLDADGFVAVDMKTLGVFNNDKGLYNIGITAVDDVGNESTMKKYANFSVDYNAPPTVGKIDISYEVIVT